MELLSKWRVKPYINLRLWGSFHKQAGFAVINPDELYTLVEFDNFSVKLSDGYFTSSRLGVPLRYFNELFYQSEEAPPMQLEPKPYFHGSVIRVRQDLAPQDQKRMNYYHGEWNCTFHDSCEGRYDYIPMYQLELVDSRNTGCMLTRFMVEEYFEVIDEP